MTGTSPGDPRSLSESWTGRWYTIKAQQRMCFEYTQNGISILYLFFGPTDPWEVGPIDSLPFVHSDFAYFDIHT